MRRMIALIVLLLTALTLTACTGAYGHRTSGGSMETQDEPPGGGY